jgi:hypothetical protein
MEVIHYSEMSVHIWNTRRYIPEDGNIHNYHVIISNPNLNRITHPLLGHSLAELRDLRNQILNNKIRITTKKKAKETLASRSN